MIIGLTGTLGAGKGTVADYLVAQKGFKHFAVSDTFLKGEAEKRGLPPDRITRRNIANEYRSRGPTALMEEVYKLAKNAIDDGEDVVLDPQHTAAEVGFIQSIGGVELAIDADLDIRFERIQARGGDKDQITFEKFKADQDYEMQQLDPNKNNLGAAIAKADHVILNNGTLAELHAAIDKVLKKINASS